jgi:hypothetical protein
MKQTTSHILKQEILMIVIIKIFKNKKTKLNFIREEVEENFLGSYEELLKCMDENIFKNETYKAIFLEEENKCIIDVIQRYTAL